MLDMACGPRTLASAAGFKLGSSGSGEKELRLITNQRGRKVLKPGRTPKQPGHLIQALLFFLSQIASERLVL